MKNNKKLGKLLNNVKSKFVDFLDFFHQIMLRLCIDEKDAVYMKKDDDFGDVVCVEEIHMPIFMGMLDADEKHLPLPRNIKSVFVSLVFYRDFIDESVKTLKYLKEHTQAGWGKE